MKRALCIFLIAATLLTALPALAAVQDIPNWYEVFVRSYQDSDGDGLGDLQGLISRLDYIYDMGWRGIWLMPVMPSPSYHKYDVTDYCAIDPEYGTLDDMRALVAACHDRGISLIVDLPLNHTSVQHPWFLAAAESLRTGAVEEPYISYYNFSREPADGSVSLEDSDWYYEERFSGGGMPDLNLDCPAVLTEIEDILRFWLADVGVDGFRLDAVTSFYTRQDARNVEFLARLKGMCEAIRPGSILIGECWASLSVIAEYYGSGVDSFFLFPAAQADGFIVKSILARKSPAEKFARGYQAVLDAIPEGYLTPFLCNHDTGRTVGLVQGRSRPDLAKLAEGVMGTLGGGTFHYYGEEIGMVGSGDDPNKRLAMYWSEEDMTLQPPGVTALEYPYPCLEAQQADPASLLNYVKAVNHARLALPAISQGENEFLLAEGSICLMHRFHPMGDCLIAINFSAKEVAAIPCDSWQIAFDLETGGDAARLEDGNLILPPQAIAILTREE